ncbi:MAG: hypothetical protein ABEJ27_01775 [Halodesulfurarchaeum sp.]
MQRHLPLAVVGAFLVSLSWLVVPAAGHAGSLNLSAEPSPIPRWVYAMSGGGVVAFSFLLTSLVTETDLVHVFRGRSTVISRTGWRFGQLTLRVVGILGLFGVLVVGFVGPTEALTNLAVLLVWVGWWAGYTMSTYLLGNSWPLLNPWRTIARFLPSLDRRYPDSLGAWPAVVGLLVLVFVEVVSPLADSPRQLSIVVLGYTVITLIGAMLYGRTWFESVDPVSRVFRYYGQIAPLNSADGRLRLSPPTARLSTSGFVQDTADVAFLIGLLWVTTFDGLVSTPLVSDFISGVVSTGLPPLVAYAGILGVGYGVFIGVYWAAARAVRRTADSYVRTAVIARRFAPTLLPIAAAYHLAHFLGYFIEIVPALGAALVSPFTGAARVPVLSVPAWFGGVELLFVILGHVLAVWASHGTAFDLFVGRIQPIRSQYPFVVVMVLYTVTSMWIIAQPIIDPAFV